PATIEEIRWTEDTVFQRAGDRAYAYRIELANGQILGFGAQTTAVIGDEQYEEAKAVLDAMMESLQLSGG
ncbi:MAG: hypothetical protein M3Y29_06320, partial [Chloroflexota bacterium]|nr:hypothetical protein [Chloroflexota bacterium]